MLASVRERQDLLHELTELLHATPTTTHALIIHGAEGVGKTHTLHTALHHARQHGHHTIGPIDGRDITTLHPATPLPEPLAGHPLPPDDHAPLTIGVDDAHLADPARLRLDMRWLTKNRHTHTLWILTTRPGTLTPTAIAATGTTHTTLGNLTQPSVTALTTDLLGTPPGPDLLAFLHQANGHPRLITNLITGLRNEGTLHNSGGHIHLRHPRIPQQVLNDIRHRLSTLTPRCRQMIHVAATLNRRFCLITVADMLNQPVARLLPLLDEATDAGLVTTEGTEPAFRNTMLWHLIRACLPASLRTALHHQPTNQQPPQPPAPPDPVLARLTDKERAIAKLAAQGLTNQQIARRVYLSPHTVNYHLRHIFRKLAITSRIELTRLVATNN